MAANAPLTAIRTAQRRTAIKFLVVYTAIALTIVGCGGGAEGEPIPADQVQVTDARTCATAAVYAVDANGWDQRAVAAQAALNRFARLAHVPNCGTLVAKILTTGMDPVRWQEAIDAVDAVQSGTYSLPLACVRVDTVQPIAVTAGVPLPLSSESARTQCVLGDLAFYRRADA